MSQKMRTVQGSLVTAEDAIDLLTGLVGDGAKGRAVSKIIL